MEKRNLRSGCIRVIGELLTKANGKMGLVQLRLPIEYTAIHTIYTAPTPYFPTLCPTQNTGYLHR